MAVLRQHMTGTAGADSRSSADLVSVIKSAKAAVTLNPQRRPTPLLVSNFITPLLSQTLAAQRSHRRLVAQGKRPMGDGGPPDLVADFLPLPAKNPTGNTTKSSTTKPAPPLPSQTITDPRVTKSISRPEPPAAGKTPLTKSFREAVSASWSQTVDVSFSPPSVPALSTHNGEPALVISEEDESRFAESFRYALIGKFLQGRPVMADIRNDIQAAGFSGACYVGLIDHRHVIFQFQNEADSHRFWMKKVWKFHGFEAKIFRWTTDFCTQKESSLAPVWINFPLLPVHLCNKETLFNLGSVVGKPLKLDLATAAMDKVLRPSEARVCIEIDVLKPLPHRVWIETKKKGLWQQIIYEDLPEYCSSCAKMGHSDSKCKLKHPSQVWIPKKKKEEGKGLQDLPSKEMELGSGCDLQPEPLAIVKYSQATKMESPTNMESPINHFLVNLGHLLDLIKVHEKETEASDVTGLKETNDPEKCQGQNMGPSAIFSIVPFKEVTTPPSSSVRSKELKPEGINVSISWEEGELSTKWNKEEWTQIPRRNSTSALSRLQIIPLDSEPENNEYVSDWMLDEDGIPTLDICDDDPGAETPISTGLPELLGSAADFSKQFVAGLGSVLDDASDVDDEVAIARGVLAGGKVIRSAADFARSFSRANLEDENKRKYGMSDRVLRSMIRASNSDPCRPGSL